MSSPRETGVVILAGVRTGFGAFGGALKDLSATDLGAVAAQAAVERSGVAAADVDHVVIGNVLQTSADAPYLARHIGLRVGLPIETPALTVNRLCGSGFEAVVQGAQQILLGESRVVLAGGTESMSQAPHVVRGARWGLRLGSTAPLEDPLWEALRDAQCGLSMAETAERLAEQCRIDRAAVDAYAARSQAAAKAAWDAGAFAEEVVPVAIADRKTRQAAPWAADEHMRPGTTVEALAKLPPYFRKDGVVTAGNASGICDGAAALVVAGEQYAAQRTLRPLGRLVAWGVAGVDPSIMGIGPVPAARQALAAAGRTLQDMDLVEINEAFAAQVLACLKAMSSPKFAQEHLLRGEPLGEIHPDRLNVNGGAIALGHPVGATGTRLVLTLLQEMRRRAVERAVAALCVGGGQGAAILLERD